MSENKKNQCWAGKSPRQSDDSIAIYSDGRNHKVKASGDVAKGIAAAAVAIAGFVVGLLLS